MWLSYLGTQAVEVSPSGASGAGQQNWWSTVWLLQDRRVEREREYIYLMSSTASLQWGFIPHSLCADESKLTISAPQIQTDLSVLYLSVSIRGAQIVRFDLFVQYRHVCLCPWCWKGQLQFCTVQTGLSLSVVLKRSASILSDCRKVGKTQPYISAASW